MLRSFYLPNRLTPSPPCPQCHSLSPCFPPGGPCLSQSLLCPERYPNPFGRCRGKPSRSSFVNAYTSALGSSEPNAQATSTITAATTIATITRAAATPPTMTMRNQVFVLTASVSFFCTVIAFVRCRQFKVEQRACDVQSLGADAGRAEPRLSDADGVEDSARLLVPTP